MAPDGRRILIGWMGIGDIPYYNKTVTLGYQHCLTIPREIVRKNDGILLQNPINEICTLRNKPIFVAEDTPIYAELPFDMVSTVDNEFIITIDNAIELSWDKELFTLKFTDKDAACGRDIRKAKLDECSSIRIIADKSSLEIYLNGGKTVFSTRMYLNNEKAEINTKGIAPIIYPLNGMEVKYFGE